MPKFTLICRNATTFKPDGALDEEAFAKFLQTLIDQNLGFYIGSGASGEGHSLTMPELGRLYEIGVAMGGGKVPVNANPPEQNTARGSIEHAKLAADAKVDVINIYGPAAWHGYIPTDEEYAAYFDDILAEVKHPVALAPNPIIGYTPNPKVLGNICKKHSQIVAINMSGQDDTYFLRLQDCLPRPIPLFVQVVCSLNLLGLGAAGLLGAEANIIPTTHRRYLDLYEAGKYDEMAEYYGHIRRFCWYTSRHTSAAGTPRWIKMAMRALKLPGGEGGPRRPYLPPPQAEYERFVDGMLRLRIPEIDDLARAAGLTLPPDDAPRT